MPRLAASLIGLAAVASLPAAALAEGPRRFEADYVVSVYGLPVGKARFRSEFEGKRFRIEGTLSSAGLARLFDKTQGTTTVRGRIGPDGLEPRRYDVDYTSGDDRQRTTIRFADGKVSARNRPKTKKRGSNWVKLTQKHLRAAFDPISATLIQADDVADVCDRTINVFDGEMRADIKLTHQSTGEVKGFSGQTVTCRAEFIPVAGYRKGRDQLEYLRTRSRMTVAFAPLEGTGFYSPVDASIGTEIGTVRIRAQRIVAE